MMTKAFPAVRVILLLVLISCAAFSGAQISADHASPQAQVPSPQAQDVALPPGTVLSAELSKSLDAKKSKPNDKVEAKTAADLLLHGQIIIPRNAKILGHVTEAKAHSKTSPGSEIKLTFDRIVLKGGREIPAQFTVQAIARPLRVPSFGSGPDGMGDASSLPGRMPSMGSQMPAGAASSTASQKYPDDMNPPPVNHSDTPSPSTATPLGATSRGVVGIKGLTLNTSGVVSVLASDAGNVHLDSGSQLALRVQ